MKLSFAMVLNCTQT